MTRLSFAVAGTLLLPVFAQAQTPIGRPIRVDVDRADSAFNWENERDVSVTPSGQFIVVWPTSRFGVQGSDIASRRFDAEGRPLAAPAIVNTTRAGDQFDESVASDDAGNFVVVWQNYFGGVFGQRFDAAGARRGGEFLISATGDKPQAAMSPAGEVVVTWAGNGVYARRYDASGNPVGAELQVSPVGDYTALPSVDVDGAGDFVVVWGSPNGSGRQQVYGRLFTSTGAPVGAQFAVSSAVVDARRHRVARARSGSFVVAWLSSPPFGVPTISARRFASTGAPVGGDFLVTSAPQGAVIASLDADADAVGDFVVAWEVNDQVRARRVSSAGAALPEFRVGPVLESSRPSVGADAAGNFIVTWRGERDDDYTAPVYAQRYGVGLVPVAITVDAAAGPSSDVNGVLEAGETAVVAPAWANSTFAAVTFGGSAAGFTGPGAPNDPSYTIADGTVDYGTAAAGSTASCSASADCYALGLTVPATRPAAHWDATLQEELTPAALGVAKTWTLHVGDSFGDVPRPSPFYRFVETLLHRGVTGGCAAGTYCPSSETTRAQMAVFVLVAKEYPGYTPPASCQTIFADVPASSPFCPWIEELARRGVVSGCGGGNYCPDASVSREQMATFVLRASRPELTPPACIPPNLFADVPETSPFCAWIEDLARRGVVAGCGGGSYCPTAAVTREQMAVFISAGFGLQLYGP